MFTVVKKVVRNVYKSLLDGDYLFSIFDYRM